MLPRSNFSTWKELGALERTRSPGRSCRSARTSSPLATLESVRPHLASLVEDFRHHGAQTAVVVYRGNRRYATSYAELADLTGRFSAELARRGIGPGERVILWGENSAEWIAAFFGCLLRGVIAVPLDLAGSSDFAARVVSDVAPRLVVGERGLL